MEMAGCSPHLSAQGRWRTWNVEGSITLTFLRWITLYRAQLILYSLVAASPIVLKRATCVCRKLVGMNELELQHCAMGDSMWLSIVSFRRTWQNRIIQTVI